MYGYGPRSNNYFISPMTQDYLVLTDNDFFPRSVKPSLALTHVQRPAIAITCLEWQRALQVLH